MTFLKNFIKDNLLIIIIVFLSLAVRLYGINFGLPDKYIIDENDGIYFTFYYASHALRPLMYGYAPLIPLILTSEFGVYYLLGKISGIFTTPQSLFVAYLKDPTIFFIIGRVTMMLSGVVTVWVLWKTGNRFFNRTTGLIAAFFMAFLFLHVKESHYIKSDVIEGLFVLACFYFALKISHESKMRNYIWAGVFFGLSTATKYNSIIILPVILLAHWLGGEKREIKRLLAAAFFAIAVFALIHPYFIIDPINTFKKTLAAGIAQRGLFPEHLQGKDIWWWFMFEHIPQGMGILLYISGWMGFAVCLRKGWKNKQYLMIPLMPLIFFLTVDSWTKLHYARYAIIILPFFVLSAAVLVESLSQIFRNKYFKFLFLVLICMIVIYQPLARTIKFDVLIIQPDTRMAGKKWIEKNVPAGQKVLTESDFHPEYPSFEDVTLVLDKRNLEKRIAQAKAIHESTQFLDAYALAYKGRAGYNIVPTTRVDLKLDILSNKITVLKDTDYYIKNGVKYLILTSWVERKQNNTFWKSLKNHYKLKKEFRPTYEMAWDPYFIRVDYQALDSVDIFREDLAFGPVIQIYEKK